MTSLINIIPLVPTLVHEILDQTVEEDCAWSFQVPADTFTGAVLALTYVATLANGDPLPSWLSFDVLTLTFSGTPPEDWNGSLTLTVTALDGLLSALDSFTLTVLPVNDAPVATDITDKTFDEDQPVVFTVPAFSDVDGDDLAYTATLANGDPLPSWLVFDAVTRSFSGTPPQNWNGSLTLKVTASDGTLTASDTFALTIGAVNDAPVAAAIADKSFSEDQPVVFTVPAFSDVDSSLAYTATLANGDPLPSWLAFDAATRGFSGTPPQNWNGSLTLKVTASDGTLTASDTFALTIGAVNDAPVGVKLAGATVQEAAAQGTVVGTLFVSDADSESFTYTLLDDAGGRFALSGNQIVVADRLLLDYEQQASHSVQVRVSDGQGGSFTQTFDLGLANRSPETISGDGRANILLAGRGKDVLSGADGKDLLAGGSAKDKLSGGKGNDDLVGGKGGDLLKGQGGADDFIFASVKDSGLSPNKRDTIVGFKGKDDLDLSEIDAITGGGKQAFQLDADGSFSAGEIRQTHVKEGLLVEMNIDGDAKAEMSILLKGYNGLLDNGDFLF